MKILILCVSLLIATIILAGTSYRLPTREDLVKHYKAESSKHMLEAMQEANTASVLEAGCYDVIISSDNVGNIQFELKEKK